MKSDIGLTGIWPTLSSFQTASATIEDSVGPAEAVDIDSYARWRHFVEKGSPLVNTGTGLTATFDFARPNRPVIVIDVEPNHLYLVRFTENLQKPKNSKEIARLRTSSRRTEQMTVPVQTKGKQGFWMIERIKD
jgi:hypothetical protein